jgi:phospholipid N-methyltransferase
VELSGEPAVDVCERHGAFGEGRTILEIGPGYGRIMGAVLERGVAFERYLGLELSEQNASHLRREFTDPRIEIVQGDAESTQLGEKVDAVFSFLTFKHLYPSFEGALTNLRPQLREGAVVIFDLIEGSRSYFQRDEQTFVHEYTRAEAEEIVARSGLALETFDTVEHAPERTRLVVVARA